MLYFINYEHSSESIFFIFELTGSLQDLDKSGKFWQSPKNKKAHKNQWFAGLKSFLLGWKSGGEQQKVEPNLGIIEQNLYFEIIIE